MIDFTFDEFCKLIIYTIYVSIDFLGLENISRVMWIDLLKIRYSNLYDLFYLWLVIWFLFSLCTNKQFLCIFLMPDFNMIDVTYSGSRPNGEEFMLGTNVRSLNISLYDLYFFIKVNWWMFCYPFSPSFGPFVGLRFIENNGTWCHEGLI